MPNPSADTAENTSSIPEIRENSLLENQVIKLFSDLPQTSTDLLLQQIKLVDHSLIQLDVVEKDRRSRITSLVEGIIAYKSGTERVEGEKEPRWTMSQEAHFRQLLHKNNLINSDFAQKPVMEDIKRSIIDVVKIPVSKPTITQQLWKTEASSWKRILEDDNDQERPADKRGDTNAGFTKEQPTEGEERDALNRPIRKAIPPPEPITSAVGSLTGGNFIPHKPKDDLRPVPEETKTQ